MWTTDGILEVQSSLFPSHRHGDLWLWTLSQHFFSNMPLQRSRGVSWRDSLINDVNNFSGLLEAAGASSRSALDGI